MIGVSIRSAMATPAISRLAALAPLDEEAITALHETTSRSELVRGHREIVVEGAPIGEPRLLVNGWAARVRQMADGRRQFLNFLLPGDLIGLCQHARPVAASTVVALTSVTSCVAPRAERFPTLAEAYAVSRALDESYLLEQILRLGRLSALERILSLFLELEERLAMARLASGGAFQLPLTQEQLADALGLTSVHINRMIQEARRQGLLTLSDKRLVIRDSAQLAKLIGRTPTRVSSPSRPAALAE